jgi:ABC-type transport system involved in cytochrome c biogenesis permease subunit
MPSLVAVLDTNFWLSTHVTTISMGYASGMLASAFAHVYVFGRLFGGDRFSAARGKGLVRMIYGVVCFGLIFSVVGTILGGVWANESWGRFWGWDPKENGALMIVLWNLFILHARMGGYIRDLGIATAAIFGGMIVAFSWWGVNLLGIGLHSYGFTNGILRALAIFYVIELGALAAAGVLAWRGRSASMKVARSELALAPHRRS